MKKAYSYIRFSTPEQLKGDSLRRQLEASQAYAQQNDLELDTSMRDLGVSAFKGRNRTEGALKKFIDLVDNGVIEKGSVLILESLDRLSRQEIMSALNLFTSILSAGIEIHTLSDNQHYTAESINNIGNLIISLVVMSRAHEESLMKSKRLQAAWVNKRALAVESKRPMTRRCPKWLDLSEDRSHFIINEERADIVREMFKLSISGLGYRLIASRLNERNYPTWGGGEFWHTSIINKILNAHSTYGAHQSSKNRKPFGDLIMDYYPAIITEDIFYQTQAAKKGRNQNHAGRKGNTFSNLLTGMCKCAYCGSTMRFLNKGNKHRPNHGGKNSKYFACTKNINSAGCDNCKKWRYDIVENAVLMCLTEAVDWFSILGGNFTKRTEIERKLTTTEAKLADSEKRTERLSELFLNADDSALENARALYVQAMEQISLYKKELEKINAELHSFIEPEENTKALSDAVYKLKSTKAPEELYILRARVNNSLKKAGLVFYFANNIVYYKVNGHNLEYILVDDSKDLAASIQVAVMYHAVKGGDYENERLQKKLDDGKILLAKLHKELAIKQAAK